MSWELKHIEQYDRTDAEYYDVFITFVGTDGTEYRANLYLNTGTGGIVEEDRSWEFAEEEGSFDWVQGDLPQVVLDEFEKYKPEIVARLVAERLKL